MRLEKHLGDVNRASWTILWELRRKDAGRNWTMKAHLMRFMRGAKTLLETGIGVICVIDYKFVIILPLS